MGGRAGHDLEYRTSKSENIGLKAYEWCRPSVTEPFILRACLCAIDAATFEIDDLQVTAPREDHVITAAIGLDYVLSVCMFDSLGSIPHPTKLFLQWSLRSAGFLANRPKDLPAFEDDGTILRTSQVSSDVWMGPKTFISQALDITLGSFMVFFQDSLLIDRINRS